MRPGLSGFCASRRFSGTSIRGHPPGRDSSSLEIARAGNAFADRSAHRAGRVSGTGISTPVAPGFRSGKNRRPPRHARIRSSEDPRLRRCGDGEGNHRSHSASNARRQGRDRSSPFPRADLGPSAFSPARCPSFVTICHRARPPPIPTFTAYQGPIGIILGLEGGLTGRSTERSVTLTVPLPERLASASTLASRPGGVSG